MSYRFCQEDDPDSPWHVFERVLTFPELELQAQLVVEHEVRFAFLLRYDESDKGWMRGQRRILGTAQMPGVMGSLRDLFEQLLEDTLGYWPDFLIILDGHYWDSASDMEREALVVHETLHCGQATDQYGAPKFTRATNAPVLQMISHDLEEFEAVVRRYGAWKSDIASFRDAIDAGPRIPNARRGPADTALGEVMRAAVAKLSEPGALPEGVTVSLWPSTAELPPNVSNVDPDLVQANNLHRGEATQDESEGPMF